MTRTRFIFSLFIFITSMAAGVIGFADISDATDLPDCGSTLASYEKNYLEKPHENGLLAVDRLDYVPAGDQYLTQAEAVAIAVYTKTYAMEERIMYCGALKLPPKAGVVFRGQSRNRFNITKKGQIITLHEIISTSTNKTVAEGFLGEDLSKSEILVIHAKTARDISMYSQCHIEGIDEKESLLLPNTTLMVNEIYVDKVRFYDEELNKDVQHEVRHVDLTEI